MINLTRLRQLADVDWRLSAEALGWVVLFRISLCWLPFRTTWSAYRRLARTWRRVPRPPAEGHFEEAVRMACRLVPGATCLTRSFALSIMLRRSGYPSEIRIGAAQEGGQFLAHAWVERGAGQPHEASFSYAAFPSPDDVLR